MIRQQKYLESIMYKTKKDRQKEAADRQRAYDALTIEERLEKLNAKFGEGQGATRERQRLATKWLAE